MLSPEQEEQQSWRCLVRYLLLQTSFLALTSARQHRSPHLRLCEWAFPYASWLWFYSFLAVHIVHNRKTLVTLLIGSKRSHACRKCPVWNHLLTAVPVQRGSKGKVLSSLGPQTGAACHPPFGLVIETYPSKNLRIWLSIPIKKPWEKWEQLIQVFGDNISREGIFVGWKIYGCPF